MSSITDRDMRYKRHSLFLPAANFMFGGYATQLAYAQQAGIGGAVAGHIFDAETTQTDNSGLGDIVEGAMVVPWQWNPDFELGFRIWFVTEAETGDETIDWIMLQEFHALGTAIDAVATSALDTAIALGTAIGTTADATYRTARGIINGGWATREQVHDGLIFQFSIEYSADTNIVLTSEAVTMLGLEIDYMPMLTVFPHNEIDGGLNDASN